MSDWKEELYNRVPWVVKRGLVAAEALRRNYYFRYGRASHLEADFGYKNYYTLSADEIKARQWQALRRVLDHARRHSTYYRDRLPEIQGLDEITALPILTKNDIRTHGDEMLDPQYPRRRLFTTMTSGSTGTPLRIHSGREGMHIRFAFVDSYFAHFDCHYGEKRARFGGARVASTNRKTPPFWIYNDVDKQLQMSPYHLDHNTYPLFIQRLNEFQPQYLTGYAHALYIMAQYLKHSGQGRFQAKAVFTDSEALWPHQRAVIEEGFQAPCYSTYGSREIGAGAVHCENNRYHVTELTCILEVVDDNGDPVPPGVVGRILITDLTQTAFPYIRYDMGDLGAFANQTCDCGNAGAVLESIDGKADDVIITPQGRRIGRIAHVINPARGILESQVVQTDLYHIVIRVVPAETFERSSMDDVMEAAKDLFGSDIHVSWQAVESIPRTRKHKFKHIVREFD